MCAGPDELPPDFAEALDRVAPRLGGLASAVLYFSTTGSTNDVAAALAAAGGREGAIVIAGAQTAGRGRRGRQWFSPPGSGLYVSVVLPLSRASRSPARATALLTLAAGVALAEGIETATGLGPLIKWPNDLLVGRRKVGGILAEGAIDALGDREGMTIILGYGINVRRTTYPPELGDRATSLEVELGRPIDPALLCAATLAAIAGRYDDLIEERFDAILDAWRARASGARGARVAWDTPTGTQMGITAGIDESGALLVRVGDRVERVVAGEVIWV